MKEIFPKPIFVLYLNVGRFNSENQAVYVKYAKEACEKFEEDYHILIIPVYDRENDTRVEVHYPWGGTLEEINFDEELVKDLNFKNVRIILKNDESNSNGKGNSS
jgi:hypothetical protein